MKSTTFIVRASATGQSHSQRDLGVFTRFLLYLVLPNWQQKDAAAIVNAATNRKQLNAEVKKPV